MTEFTEWRSLVDGERISAIPDSVVERPDDDSSNSETDARGLKFTTTEFWPDFQGRISSLTSDVSTAYITETDGSIIDTVDISDLSSGEVFTFTEIDLPSGEYIITLDNDGNSYTNGRYDETDQYPYTSDDGVLTLDNGIFNETSETNDVAYNIKEIGNIN